MPVKTSTTIEPTEEVKKMLIRELTKNEKDALASLKSTAGKSIEDIIKQCFGMAYDPTQKHVICVQGSSSSGKSTLAHNIFKLFTQSNISCVLLELDKYYKTLSEKDLEMVALGKYDFDNPGSLDWEKIGNVLQEIHDDDEYLNLYEYSFFTMKCDGPFRVKNIKPKVVIVEGIYAFNCMNKNVFNVDEFDPLNTHKEIKKEFIANTRRYLRFKILNLRMAMCRGKSLEVRIARDVLSRGKVKEYAIEQFESQVWPATTKWVNNKEFKSHFTILHGSFNEKKVKLFVGGLSGYFINRKIVFERILKSEDFNKEAMVECSGECNLETGTELLLKED